MKIIQRNHITASRTVEYVGHWLTDKIKYFYEVLLVQFYKKRLTFFLELILIGLSMLLYIIFFIVFLLFSIGVELYEYTKQTQIKNKSEN
jgi:hypothetical protein